MGGFGKGTMEEEEEEEEIHKLHISSLEEPRGRSWSGSILLDILANWMGYWDEDTLHLSGRTSRRASWQELVRHFYQCC